MIKFDDKELRGFERDLLKFRERAYPFATKETVNNAAKATQGVAKNLVAKRMILRNRFTLGSIQATFERGLNVSRQRSIVGSVQPYMETQEFGGTKRGTGKHGVLLPTSTASGEGRNAQPRRKLPTRANNVRNITLPARSRGRGKSRKQRNMATIQAAVSSGGRKARYVALRTRRGVGIFRIKGSKRSTQIDMVADLSHRTVSIPANPWLKPAVDRVARTLPKIYKKALRKQIVRHRIFVRR